MSQLIVMKVQGTVQTVGTATATVASFTLPAGCSAYVKARISGRDTTSGDTIAGESSARTKQLAGTSSVIGSVVALAALAGDAALSTSTFTIDASGADIRLRATGTLLKTIEWFGELEIWIN